MEAKEITYDEMREKEIQNIQKESESSQPLLALSLSSVSNNCKCDFVWNTNAFNTLYIGLKTPFNSNSSCQVMVDTQYTNRPNSQVPYTIKNGRYFKFENTYNSITSISISFMIGKGLTPESILSIGVI
ncbi:hypothetical protein ABW636_03105 [Aquimarina sp. 2201CG1-2-11]|uniref:hypothetical protein n=1 Tax=Aquimarina discodermiae TaxID=3231043 RepID=UPI0034629595